jgi:methylated-DNA-[protein]-cysteine S-methyltransferase
MNALSYEHHPSPIGALTLGATDDGLAMVALPGDTTTETSERPTPAQRAILDQAHRELDEYFAGERTAFGVPLDWGATGSFHRRVLEATAAVPYGETTSYGAVAARAGSATATRAAGSALAINPLPIVVPCHRVLPASGTLGRYRGGPEAKAALLELEGAALAAA